MNLRVPLYIMIVIGLCGAFFSCTDMVPTREVRLIDSLNGKAYSYKYRDLDSCYKYAREAYGQIDFYKSGKAEACNNLGFYAFMEMDFEKAESLHKEVYKFAKNELELLIADIGLMKICQRTAMNKEFYDYRNRALRRMKRIKEDSDLFVDRHERLRLNYAFTEFYIVSAVYYYYLQQRDEAIASLDQIDQEALATDTNQLLYYHYIKGSASLSHADTIEDRALQEFDELYYTWRLASQKRYPYFEANSLQGLAGLMISSSKFDFFKARRVHFIEKLGVESDSLLPLKLAQTSLSLFKKYNDLYQVAGAYVTIGRYLNAHGCYQEALDTLSKALDCVNRHHEQFYHSSNKKKDQLLLYSNENFDSGAVTWSDHTNIKTVPEWISRIREQLSVSYAGLNNKRASDYNRNAYLDILNFTRQDKELESRYLSLEAESNQLTVVMLVVIGGLVLLIIFFIFFNRRMKVRDQLYLERLQRTLELCKDIISSIPIDLISIQQGIDEVFGKNKLELHLDDNGKALYKLSQRLNKEDKAILLLIQPYVDWALSNEQMMEELVDERQLLDKQRYIYEQHIATNKRQNVIKKSCLAIVNGMTPYIDRILNEVHKLTSLDYLKEDAIKREKFRYIDELVTTINEYNDILALWIKMKQGSLNLNIETFELNALFDLLGKGRRAYELKKQTLQVEPTDLWVKADRALTLFMINTLAENARKYTPEGGRIEVYAAASDDYVEISVQDNGTGLSQEDVSHIIEEKIYDSRSIGMEHTVDPEQLMKSKGSGFGLMNCKGIIEKYKKTNPLFKVCLFNVDSEQGKGSRFYFRLPLGVRKTFTIWLLMLLPLGLASCLQGPAQRMEDDQPQNLSEVVHDSLYEDLLNQASDYANSAYYANIDKNHQLAIQYVDSAINLLNAHYRKYSLNQPVNKQTNQPVSKQTNQQEQHFMTLKGQDQPAEIFWWNEGYNTDFHVILDLRNEAAVAFLALKQLDAYSYNNTAFTDLYKLQGEDQSLEAFCRQLEQSTINKTIGIILCLVLLVLYLIVYYLAYMRKRIQNRFNLEQVLEINKRVFSASIIRQERPVDLLEREDNALKEIPKRIVDEAYDSVNELLTSECMGIAVYNETTNALDYVSRPNRPMPSIVEECFATKTLISKDGTQTLPLMVEVRDEEKCVGVLYLERRIGTEQATDSLLFELVGRYVGIVIFNAVITLALRYRDIESAQEEAYRASWEDGVLHVQNMVLDNCLSTIKHETIYYPNKIKQIIDRLNTKSLATAEELEAVEAITELIEYYKGIFTILSSCASRQLEEVTFRRTIISVKELFDFAERYFKKASKTVRSEIRLLTETSDLRVLGDLNLLRFLFENLIDEALTVDEAGELRLSVVGERDYVRFIFTDRRRQKETEELNQLFYPSLERMTADDKGELKGTEYLICKQIIRDHDEFAGRRGCRINAEPSPDGGFSIYFTIPKR